MVFRQFFNQKVRSSTFLQWYFLYLFRVRDIYNSQVTNSSVAEGRAGSRTEFSLLPTGCL